MDASISKNELPVALHTFTNHNQLFVVEVLEQLVLNIHSFERQKEKEARLEYF